MGKELLLMPHVFFGVSAIMTAVWLIVEVVHTSESNIKRIKIGSILTTVSIWLSYVFGGFWYVNYYAEDKAIIKGGLMPWAHSLIMETKEHMFFVILFLSVFLSIVVFSNKIIEDKSIRKLVIIIAGLTIFLSLGMEFMGALVAMGVKIGLIGGV